MDENRVYGTAKNMAGKVEEGFGQATGDVKSQVEGKVKQAAGVAQDLYGQARDTASDAATAVRETASSAEDTLRNFIEDKPYTTMIVALCVGWLLGRTHRPY
jgi:uncharacterized protein YjbJ (UPF0337 family)